MSATTIDLSAAKTTDATRVTEQEGRWYLRRLSDEVEYEWHVGLLSERAPAGTAWRDLKPGRVEIICDNEDGVEIDAQQFAAFLVWPPDVAESAEATT
jgi:hypothetical protein